MELKECQTCHQTLGDKEYSYSMRFYKKPLCRPCQNLERNVNKYTITYEQEKKIDELVDDDISVLYRVLKGFGYYQVNLIQKKDYKRIYEELKEDLKEERLNQSSYNSSSDCYGGDNIDIALEAGINEEAIWG